MNRLEFRAWDNVLNRYFFPECINQIFINMDGDVMWWSSENGFENESQRIEIEIFTGLEDKNGKKIFNNDIIETKDIYCNKEKRIKSISQVTYRDGEFNISTYVSVLENVEVIGNIRNNSELLK